MPLRKVTKIFTPSTIKYEWTIGTVYWQFYRKTEYIKLFFNIQVSFAHITLKHLA